MSINRGTHKEDVVCNGILPNHEKGMPFAVTWMHLETAILRGKSYKERYISYDSTYMWNLEKWYE